MGPIILVAFEVSAVNSSVRVLAFPPGAAQYSQAGAGQDCLKQDAELNCFLQGVLDKILQLRVWGSWFWV